MPHTTVYCSHHGLFSWTPPVDHVCPKCGREDEPLPTAFVGLEECLDVLLNPEVPLKALLSLRQITFAANAGLLTPQEARKAAVHIWGDCADLFARPGNVYFELAEALGEVIKARLSGEVLSEYSGEGFQGELYGRRERLS
jgi:hypothetical protein